MTIKAKLHTHAVDRFQERFGVDKNWLIDELESGRFVWLKGSGHSGISRNVRSGHLLYLPLIDDYCVVVMDDRSKLAITVLTLEMALNSSWGKGLDDAAKLKAKRISLGKELIDDSQFLRMYAEERGQLVASVRAKTVSYDWEPFISTIHKTSIFAEQIDTENKRCILTNEQVNRVTEILNKKIAAYEIRPYCELFVSTNNDKRVLISNCIENTFPLDESEAARRWS
jgi:hypothetical protein